MFVLGELFRALAFLVNGVCTILTWLLIARIVISWLVSFQAIDPYHNIVQFLIQVTEPILAPFRRIPLRIGMLDLTPFIAFIAIYFVQSVLGGVLMRLAHQFS